MKLSQSTKFNRNYSACIVHIDNFYPHPNPKVTRMKVAQVGAEQIIVGIDFKEGDYVYFPVMSKIVGSYLSANNLFRHSELNSDSTQSGFFDDNGRVKCIKLQGFPSNGFLMPVSSLKTWLEFIRVEYSSDSDYNLNYDFDTVEGQALCKKYVVKSNRTPTFSGKKNKSISKYPRLLEGQFRFHYETEQLRRMPWVVNPNDLISITSKFHGTSLVSAYVLCKKKPTWWDKLQERWGKLLGKPAEVRTLYDYIWSSRKVVKNEFYNDNKSESYYGVDIYKYAHDAIKDKLKKGMTFYAEIVGFLPNGKPIQQLGSPYDYGCVPPTDGEQYSVGKHFRVLIYRITQTNADGDVFEFSAKQVQIYCKSNGLECVEELYYGFAKDLYCDLDEEHFWSEEFVKRLSEDKRFYMEEKSPHCKNEVPHEGIVLKIENFRPAAYKLKCQKFLFKEDAALEKGLSNIEDNES